MINCKYIARNKAGDQWSLGEPEDVCSEDFWELCSTGRTSCDSDDLTVKDRCIGLDISISFIMGRLMWKKYRNIYEEYV